MANTSIYQTPTKSQKHKLNKLFSTQLNCILGRPDTHFNFLTTQLPFLLNRCSFSYTYICIWFWFANFLSHSSGVGADYFILNLLHTSICILYLASVADLFLLFFLSALNLQIGANSPHSSWFLLPYTHLHMQVFLLLSSPAFFPFIFTFSLPPSTSPDKASSHVPMSWALEPLSIGYTQKEQAKALYVFT